MDADERFVRLRKLLNQRLTEGVMRQLEAMLRHWPEEEERTLAEDYIDAHLAHWGRSIDEFAQEEDEYDDPLFESTRARLAKTQQEERRIDNRPPKYSTYQSKRKK